MAKKNRSVRHGGHPAAGRRWQAELLECEQLAKRKRWAEARDRLEALDRRVPNRPEVLTLLVNTYYDLKDHEGYQFACERLIQVEPDNAELAMALAGAYLVNKRPALALRAARQFLRRWPDQPQAADARQLAADLEAGLPQLLAELGLSGEEGFELATRHEEIQSQLAHGHYRRMIEAAEALLKRYPGFAPALNNLSLAYWLEGQPDQAIAAAQRVLEVAPDNVHALSNLVHYLCCPGQEDEARAYAQQLQASRAPAADRWLKKAEAFSFLGDDQAVLAVLQEAEQAGEAARQAAQPMFYHLAAVAALRLGQESEARRLWQ